MDLPALWLLPLVYIAGLLAAVGASPIQWWVARATGLLGLAAVLFVVGGRLFGAENPLYTADTLGLVMAVLVSVLGWVIITYSHRYLQGEKNQACFVRATLFTLFCVSVLVASQSLLIIVLAWSGTSIGLHYLLTFYRDRKSAQIVAHKKFIVSRLADLCLLVAVLLIYNTAGTLSLGELSDYLGAKDTLPVMLHIAATLFALAAILKTAQLPLHGWLLQVMEAPTPVSALLHAGVVNIGGFILIRLSALIALAPVAQAALVIIGGVTAVLAGLVMMTRISIKVRLAWSTCAQMGFMLMEIGLGLYELALLHLVAHSLYKAHAFLSAGNTVSEAIDNCLCPARVPSRSLFWFLLAALQSAVLVVLSVSIWQWLLPSLSLPWVVGLIVALGLAPLAWWEQGASPYLVLRGWLSIVALTQLYMVWHVLFTDLAPPVAEAAPSLTLWVILCFSLLYLVQAWLRCYPGSRLASTLYPWAYNGFYLDETFTRLTFKFWPARLSPTQAQTLVNKQHAHYGDSL